MAIEQILNELLIYVVCGLVIAGCAAAFFLLSSGEGEAPRPVVPAARKPAPGPPPPAMPAVPVPESAAPPEVVVIPTPPGHKPRSPELAEAERLYEMGMERLRAAMLATPGLDTTTEMFREALTHLIASQAIYEKWVDAHPADEEALDARLTNLQEQLFWCRKTLPATAFPRTDEDEEEPPAEHPGSSRPPRPVDVPAVPPPALPPMPAFRPEEAKARFDGIARQAFAGGRPDLVLEAGLPLLTDARMDGHREGVAEAVERARTMAGFLEAAKRTFAGTLGVEQEVPLRAGPARGVVAEDGEVYVLRGPGGEKRFRLSDLSGAALAALAEAAGGLADAAQRLAGGAYLMLRGDIDEGARLLLFARAGGADVGPLGERLAQVLARNPALQALDAWLRLEPMLRSPGPELVPAVREFISAWAGTDYFAAHREEIFAAYAKAAAKRKLDPEEVYAAERKLAGKVVTLKYDFEDPGQLGDFVVQGEFKVENGALCAVSRAAWIEKFDLTNADLRFVLSEPCDVAVGFWGPNGRGMHVNFTMKPTDDLAGLEVALRRDDRAFAMERIPRLTGPTEVVIVKREDKYQVRVKNATVLKATGPSRPDEVLCCVGIACTGGPASFEELELKTDLDLEWARGGGRRHAQYVEGWWVAGAFPLEKPGNLRLGLATPEWPERIEFDPKMPGDDGKPAWTWVRTQNAAVDLNRYLKPNDRCVGYAAVRVWSAEKRAASIEVECDDDACAFLNGELVLKEAPIGQPWRAPVKLEKGDNLLLVKVVDADAGWWLRARILGKNGELLPDLLCW